MNKKKLFGALASAAMLLNGAPLNVFAEEMVETTPTGTVPGADATNVALNSENFPDNNLLNAIKNQNGSPATAGKVTTLNIPSSVQSLEGLQYLTKLTSFTMNGNNYLQSVDLSNNTALASIFINSNGVLESITLPEDEDLTDITITGNSTLDEIDLSPAALATNVDLSNNSLDELDLSGNAYLTDLDLSGNELYQLDATPCKQLVELNVSRNKLYELKVPTAVPNGLNRLYAAHNKLTEFDASGLGKLNVLDMSDNMLKTIKFGSQTFDYLNLARNHLASINLKNVKFTESGKGDNVALSPQNLYANSTDEAVNLKEYDPNFDPDKATLSNGDAMSDDSVFNISGVPGQPTSAEFTTANTKVVITPAPKLDSNGDPVTTPNGTVVVDPTLAPIVQVYLKNNSVANNSGKFIEVTDSNNYELTYGGSGVNSYPSYNALLEALNDGSWDGTIEVEGENHYTGLATASQANNNLEMPTKDIAVTGDLTVKEIVPEPSAKTQTAQLESGTTPTNPLGVPEVKAFSKVFNLADPAVQIKPGLNGVAYQGTNLTENTNYTLDWGENKTAGLGYIYITGTGSYFGTVAVTFPIEAAQYTLKVDSTFTYDGTDQIDAIKDAVTVTDQEGNTVTPKDITFQSGGSDATDLTKAGEYDITATLADGTEVSGEVTIEKASLADATVTFTGGTAILNSTAPTKSVVKVDLVAPAIKVDNDTPDGTLAYAFKTLDLAAPTSADSLVGTGAFSAPTGDTTYTLTLSSELASAPTDVFVTGGTLKVSGLDNYKDAIFSIDPVATKLPDSGGTAASLTFKYKEDDAEEENNAAMVMKSSESAGITGSDSWYKYDSNNATAGTMQVNVVKEDLMNRLYNPNSGEHFYTKDTHEKDVLVSLGWQAEGIGWVSPIKSDTPIYRLYNANAGDHHYTADVNEKDTLVRVGWSYEGIGWYGAVKSPSYWSNTLVSGDSVDGIEVFREYNPNAKEAGAHNYTINEIENDVLTSIGWLDEGIAWWALK